MRHLVLVFFASCLAGCIAKEKTASLPLPTRFNFPAEVAKPLKLETVTSAMTERAGKDIGSVWPGGAKSALDRHTSANDIMSDAIARDVNGTALSVLTEMRSRAGDEDAATESYLFASMIGVRARKVSADVREKTLGELLVFCEAAERIAASGGAPDVISNVQLFRSIELECALAVGDDTRGRELCEKMLMDNMDTEDWDYGNVIHDANMALAEIDFRRGSLDAAAAELIAAGNGPGSPQLSSFGPNFSLVPKLWRAGKREAVLDYLKGISKFYEPDRVKSWIAKLKSGSFPTDREWVYHTAPDSLVASKKSHAGK
jgi:hypothetical protein